MKPFVVNGKTFRVFRVSRLEREYGYTEPVEQQYNVLQVQETFLKMKFWKEVDREPIPAFAWIQKATLGSTDWQSPMLQKINNHTHPSFTC